MVRRRHAPAASPPRTRAIAGEQHPQITRVDKTTQHQQQHTRRSVQEELWEPYSDPDKLLRRSRGQRATSHEDSVDSNGAELEARSPSTTTPGVATPSESIINSSSQVVFTPDSQDSIYSIQEDSVESWYRNVGYVTDLDESVIQELEHRLPEFTMRTYKQDFCKTMSDRTRGLIFRNVQVDPCQVNDSFFDDMEHLQPSASASTVNLLELPELVQQFHIEQWELDVKKARNDEIEAIFQRTVMISMLDRFRLIYKLRTDDNQPILDFAVESRGWKCPFMPTLALKKDPPDRKRMLSRPKPDVSIAFHLRSILGDTFMAKIPEAVRSIMVYEDQNDARPQRAFHFLIVEAKNADRTSTDKGALIQCLNSASQSLHCLYEFCNEADRKEVECCKSCCNPDVLPNNINAGVQSSNAMRATDQGPSTIETKTFVDRFFESVRVFTAVPTGKAITIRIHRAYSASATLIPPIEDQPRPPFQSMILNDYPLQFEYNEIVTLTEDAYNLTELVKIFKKIMIDYGVGHLRPLLKEAGEAIATKFDAWEQKHGRQYELGMRHYSHGQTAPTSEPGSYTSKRNSRTSNRSTRRSSGSTRSSMQGQSPARQSSLAPSAPSPPARLHPSFTSDQDMRDLPQPAKKRTRTR